MSKSIIAGLAGFVVGIFMLAAPIVQADDLPIFAITIKNNQFQPAKLSVPAGKQFRLVVHNQTNRPAEIESYDFTMEKVVPSNTKVSVYAGPLKAGSYKFFNDFAQGVTGNLVVE